MNSTPSPWPEADAWRAPPAFPPAWASAWGDDEFGLWAELHLGAVVQRLRWIEPTGPGGAWVGARQKERDAIEDADYRRWANQNESEPRQHVLAQGLWLADTPCTQALWLAVAGSKNPSQFHDRPDAAQRPVEQVRFDEVTPWLSALARRLPAGSGEPGLPDEWEWEVACRAGSRSAYHWGDAADETLAHFGRHAEETAPVKQYPPNAWGLHDLHGNVWEWCGNHVAKRGESLPSGSSAPRAVRGGSWGNPPASARCASRDAWPPVVRRGDLGFRLALRSPEPSGGAAGG